MLLATLLVLLVQQAFRGDTFAVALATRPAVAASSRDADLRQTLDVILQHWRKREGGMNVVDDARTREAKQRSILAETLRQETWKAQRKAVYRAEVRQRALLAAQLSVGRQRQAELTRRQAQRAEYNQRALLRAHLSVELQKKQMEDRQRGDAVVKNEYDDDDDPKGRTSTRSPQQQEANQRALLATQLAMAAQTPISLANKPPLAAAAPSQASSSPTPTNVVKRPVERLRQVLLDKYSASLIRIACAYNRNSDSLFPRHVTQIEILSMPGDETNDNQEETLSMDLAVLVCDAYRGGDCVNVAVQIPLSNDCRDRDNEAWVQCRIEQVLQLDQTALIRLEQAEKALEKDDESVLATAAPMPSSSLLSPWSSENSVRRALEEAPVFRFGGDIPDWWTVGDVELQRECDSLKVILNERDFWGEITALARQYAVGTGDDIAGTTHTEVTEAGVALVGSSGLLLRAQLQSESEGSTWKTLVTVPVPYPQGMVRRKEELQAAVLALVGSVATG